MKNDVFVILTVGTVLVLLGLWGAVRHKGDLMRQVLALQTVFLGAVFSGQMMTLFYSLGGGLLAWLIMCLLRPVFHKEHLWLCSPVAALFHNLGQLLVAAAIMRTWAVLAYLPYLALSGVITGLFTGLCTQFLMARLKKLH